MLSIIETYLHIATILRDMPSKRDRSPGGGFSVYRRDSGVDELCSSSRG